MLETISQVLQSIGDFLGNIGDWVTGFLEDLLTMAEYLATAVAEFPDYFTWLPAGALALLTTAVGIIVIYKFLGRD